MDVSMDWLLDSLRVVREVRDWAAARRRRDPSAKNTQHVLDDATRKLEAVVRENGVDPFDLAQLEFVPPQTQLVPPLGPDPTPLQGPPPKDKPPKKGTKPRPLNGVFDDTNADPQRVPEAKDPAASEDALIVEAIEASRRISNDDIDQQAILAIKRLRRYGYKGYLVGGCVRDLLLGITPKDFDIATDARPEEVKAIFKNSRIIGRRFRLVHLYYRGGKVLEVATFRASIPADDEDEGTGDLFIRRDNVFGTEQEDAQRRDFTINALFYDPESGQIIDHVGGLRDIDARVVRMIGDPHIRLREDPVRIVRAIRFRAKAGLALEEDLEAALPVYVDELVRCPPARLLEETLKLLRMGHALASFDEMLIHGVLEVLLPEVKAFIDGHLSLLAGSPVMEDRNPLEEIRAHLEALDEIVARSPVSDDIVLGALLFPMADAVLCHADIQGRDRNRSLTEFLGEVGVRIQFTRKLSEQLRQSYGVQRYFASESSGRRRRRLSPSTLMRRSFFPAALRLFEIRQRATHGSLEEVRTWEVKAYDEGIDLGGRLVGPTDGYPPSHKDSHSGGPRKKRRRNGRRRKQRPMAERSGAP